MAILFAVIAALLSYPASAAELALLRNGFSIRHEHRLVIGDNTRLFFDGDNASFVDVPTAEIEGFEKDLTQPALPEAAPAPALDLNQVVNSASATYHLDPDLVNSVIHAESGFNSHAVSRKGAQGLMQLMPDTASRLGVANAFDPQSNVGGGSRYLRELLERYNFDLIKALAAYNAGPQRVEQYKGVPPYSETRAYVARIVREYNRKKIAQEKQEKQAAAERAKTKTTQPPAPSAAASQPQH
ncbi:MAG TPA: lytic transglycosylase domain-containing protein [Terriglobales bacterium]